MEYILKKASELGHALPTTRATLSLHTLGVNTTSESSLPRAMKNSPCRPRVLAGTGRQLLA